MIEGTEWQGHVFAVGGCCRDMILKRPINDVDLAVDLVDGGVRFARWLSNKGHTMGRPVIFARYGTAMVHLRRFGGAQVEIVQTRKAKYTPDIADTPEVAFGTLEEDAHRRDLTINSLYLDLHDFKMVDFCGGVDDIRNRILRTPMDADEIFADDPVRALRVLRFATVLKWPIEPQILPAIRRAAPQLNTIKVERISNEFEKMIASAHPGFGLRLLDENDMLGLLLPGMEKLSPTRRRTIETVVNTKSLTEPAARLAAICIMMSLSKSKNYGEEVLSSSSRGASALDQSQSLLRRLHTTSSLRHRVDFFTRNWRCTERWGIKLEHLKPRLLRGFMRMCGNEKTLMLMLDLIEAVRKHTKLKAWAGQIALIKQRIVAEDLIDSVYGVGEAKAGEAKPSAQTKRSKAKRRREKRRRERRRQEKRMKNQKNNE